jgi:hypothetical protein
MENHPTKTQPQDGSHLENKWWFRVAKVVYVFLYLFFAIGIIASGIDNFFTYEVNTGSVIYTPVFAFINVLIVVIIGFVVIKAIKIIFFYTSIAQRPNWKKELTNIF